MLKHRIEADPYYAIVAFPSPDSTQPMNDMFDEAFGRERWTVTAYDDVDEALQANDAGEGRFFAIGVQSGEDDHVNAATTLIAKARETGRHVILLAEALDPARLHQIMRAGAEDFAPLPLPPGALSECVARFSSPGSAADSRRGAIYAIYGAAGGVGASTLAVNLAWETACAAAKSGRRAALLDFNFQYGAIATYLDLPRREAIYELLSDTSTIDEESFGQALTEYGDRMAVLTAPMDALPLDIIGPDDVRSFLEMSRAHYDFTFIDLPQTLTHWSDLILAKVDQFFAVMETDMRSAQNMLRFIRALQSESLPIEKVSVCLNRAPSFTDVSGKSRSRKLEETLGVKFAHFLPDGGKQVVQACDQGEPLAKFAKGNALRKAIVKMAQSVIATADASKAEKAL